MSESAVHQAVDNLIEAVKSKNLPRVRKAIAEVERVGGSVSSQNASKQTALHIACWFDHHDGEVMRELLDKGADAKAEDGNRWTPVHYAAFSQALSALDLLAEYAVRYGLQAQALGFATADVHADHMTDTHKSQHHGKLENQTPLQLATLSGKAESIRRINQIINQLAAPIHSNEQRKRFLDEIHHGKDLLKNAGQAATNQNVQRPAAPPLNRQASRSDAVHQPQSNAMSSTHGARPNSHQDLLAQIRAGQQLKKAPSKQAQSQEPSSAPSAPSLSRQASRPDAVHQPQSNATSFTHGARPTNQDLLAQIRAGQQLKKTPSKQVQSHGASSASVQGGELNDALKAAMVARRIGITGKPAAQQQQQPQKTFFAPSAPSLNRQASKPGAVHQPQSNAMSSPRAPAGDKADLLQQIRAGKQLKKTSPKQVGSTAPVKGGGLMAAMQAAMAAQGKGIADAAKNQESRQKQKNKHKPGGNE